jgi:hypothetical protein
LKKYNTDKQAKTDTMDTHMIIAEDSMIYTLCIEDTSKSPFKEIMDVSKVIDINMGGCFWFTKINHFVLEYMLSKNNVPFQTINVLENVKEYIINKILEHARMQEAFAQHQKEIATSRLVYKMYEEYYNGLFAQSYLIEDLNVDNILDDMEV